MSAYHPDFTTRKYGKEVTEINRLHKDAREFLQPKELKKFEHENFYKDKINANYQLIHCEIDKLADEMTNKMKEDKKKYMNYYLMNHTQLMNIGGEFPYGILKQVKNGIYLNQN